MQIPIGARIDRKTWEVTPLYREGSADEFIRAIRPIIEAAHICEANDERKGEISMTGETR